MNKLIMRAILGGFLLLLTDSVSAMWRQYQPEQVGLGTEWVATDEDEAFLRSMGLLPEQRFVPVVNKTQQAHEITNQLPKRVAKTLPRTSYKGGLKGSRGSADNKENH